MVCFVFTVYLSIGEAQSGVAINKGGDLPPASDLLTIETTSQPALHKSDKARSLESEASLAELPLGVEDVGAFESKENQDGIYVEENEPAGQLSENEPTHLNERILQLQKKELDKSLDTPTENDGY